MKIFTIYYTFFLCLITLISQGQEVQGIPEVRYMTVNDGLSNLHIKTIDEDKLGNIWFGGASMSCDFYDGQSIQHVVKVKRHKKLSTLKTHQTSDGSLWFFYTGSGIFSIIDPLTKKVDTYETLPEYADTTNVIDLQKIRIHDCFLDEKEKQILLISKSATIYQIRLDDTLKPSSIQKMYSLPKQNIRTLFVKIMKDADNTVWASYGYKIYCKTKESKSFEKIELKDRKNTLIRGIYQDLITKKVLIATTKGILKFDKKQHMFIPLISEQEEHLLNQMAIVTLHQDKKGQLWVGTKKGLYYVSSLDKNATIKNIAPDLVGKKIHSIYSDSYGGIWFAAQFVGVGYIHLYDTPFVFIKGEEGSMKESPIRKVITDKNGAIWMLTSKGLSIYDPKVKQYYYYSKGDNRKQKSTPFFWGGMEHILVSSDGSIWICYKNRHLYKITGKDYNNLTFKHILLDSKVRGITGFVKDKQGVFWVSTSFKEFFKYNLSTNSFRKYKDKKLKSDITSLTLDNKNANIIWATTKKEGLKKIIINAKSEIEKVVTYLPKPQDSTSLKSKNIHKVKLSEDGSIWVLNGGNKKTYISHLVDSKKGIFEHIPIHNTYYKQFQVDKNNNLWLVSNELSLLNIKEGKIRVFKKSDIKSNIFVPHCSYQDDKGNLYFGGTFGLNIINADKVQESPYSPTFYFSDLYISGDKIEVGKKVNNRVLLEGHLDTYKEITLAYNENDLAIDIKGIYPPTNYELVYKYKLEGYRDKWIEAIDGQINFGSLPSGEYKLMVYVDDQFGHQSEERVLKITVLAPWWETWWFRLLLIALVIIIPYGIYRRKLTVLKANKAKLEAIVKQRTKEIATQNEELIQQSEEIMAQKEHISEQHEQIVEKNENIIASIKYAKTIQRALLSSMNTIISYFPEHLVLYKPKDIVSGDFYWGYEKNGKLFIALVDCTGHGVPGALLSVLGINILNKVVGEMGIESPELILEHVNTEVQQLLSQDISRNDDGMDMSICVFEKSIDNANEMKVSFAGAKSNMTVVRTNTQQAEVIKGTKRSIGGWSTSTKRDFEYHSFILSKGDSVYLNSDGYIDQANVEGRKFGTKRFIGMLEETSLMNMTEQEEEFNNRLETYMNEANQRDDITVLGIRM